jgi:uncharacterized protein YxeA
MKIFIQILISIVIITIGIYIFPNINISVTQPTIEAQSILPTFVEKFSDGTTNCYVYSNVWNKYGGISCVQNK